MPPAPRIPDAPRAIQKGASLKDLLDETAIRCLGENVLGVDAGFDAEGFCERALDGLAPLSLMQRGRHIAAALQSTFDAPYESAIAVLLDSLTPPQTQAEEFGLAVFFYLPHSFFIADYGLDPVHNGGADPFDTSMHALRELTLRFTAEFAIRAFLIDQQARTLAQIDRWLDDPNPHVRRLCSEGTRPRLPWGTRLKAFIADPGPALLILEALKADDSLYVRRSVANHLGDIAKDHPGTVLDLCERWLDEGADNDQRWLIRHALRYPAKKGDARALAIRASAKALK